MIQLAYQGKTNEPPNGTKQLKWQTTVLEKICATKYWNQWVKINRSSSNPQ